MFTTIQAQATTYEQFGSGKDVQAEARRFAGKLFDKAYARGKQRRWLAKLAHKANALQSFSGQPVMARRTIRTIPRPLMPIPVVGCDN